MIPQVFVLHWDGKLLPDTKGREKVDRLALVVTGENCQKMLEIPKVENGTGEKMAESIHEFLHLWKMEKLVEIVCFDTTASNTGIHRGSAYLLEKKLGRSLLFFPCRHHISELLLKAVFELYLGKTSAPEVLIFDRFARKWKDIETTNTEIGIMDEQVKSVINVHQIDLHNKFCIEKLNSPHARADYKEFLELSLIFVGQKVPNFKQFRLLGATSHARFMAKAIYSYKIFLFRKQFQMTAREFKGIRGICLFLTRLYIQYWFGCVNAIEAPRFTVY